MENEISSDWEQIVIKEGRLHSESSSVFPPTEHQDLPITTTDEVNRQPVVDSVSSPDCNGIRGWRKLLLKLDLRPWISRGVNKRAAQKQVKVYVFAFASAGIAVALLVSLLRAKAVMWWQRRAKVETSKGNLLHMIKQKDEV